MMQIREAYHSLVRRDARRKRKPLPLLEEAAGKNFREGESAYSTFLITAQAILAGEPVEPGAATACITMEVPPLLKTEFGSSPMVTFGATTLT